MKQVNIIGAGLAGCEAAYFLANHGVKVHLYEVKRLHKNEIQKTKHLAELVCSNTFRSRSLKNAAGILKAEMVQLNSLLMQVAQQTALSADDALAVDRLGFSALMTEMINNHPNITVIDQHVTSLDRSVINIIATGPLTTDAFNQVIETTITHDQLFFLDASAPIITKDSIDFSQVFWASRHNPELKDQICIPLNQSQFDAFVDQLIHAEQTPLKDLDQAIFFKGCQPIEQLAKTSKKVLLNGPMSPNQLLDANNKTPYAVVQLRQDDALDHLYNFIGFQTNLKWGEQKRILSQLPGLANLNIVRYGVMHKNYYINSPKILNQHLQVKKHPKIFMCGQITGVEGYIEAASSGILAGMNVLAFLQNKRLIAPSRHSMLGALHYYITNPKHKSLKPMKCNLGILAQQNKSTQDPLYSYHQSQQAIETFLQVNAHILKSGACDAR